MAQGLNVDSVSKIFHTRAGELVVLRDVCLTIPGGGSVAIMGPSGSGKSTLLNIMGTLESPSSGVYSLDGENPFDLNPKKVAAFRNLRIGFVFQDHHLLPQCTALENVLIPTLVSPHSSNATGRAKELLDRVGLIDRMDHRPAELSGGERQRVAIARALINRPALLLADEPTGNLDRDTSTKVAELLMELHQADQFVFIAVTHSETFAARFPKRCELIAGSLREL